MEENLTFRRFKDDDHRYTRWSDDIFNEDTSYKCPTYVHRTPPCQGSCPSGEDIRGWLQIVRGIEKPPADMPWQEYAFRRSTNANPSTLNDDGTQYRLRHLIQEYAGSTVAETPAFTLYYRVDPAGGTSFGTWLPADSDDTYFTAVSSAFFQKHTCKCYLSCSGCCR